MAAVAAAVAAAVVTIVIVRRDAPPEQVILYGDSLSAEASDHFTRLVADDTGADVTPRVFGGTAACDWLGAMRLDAEAIEPDAVVIQFVGNAFTPCMRGPQGEELGVEEVRARYQQDLAAAAELFVDAGARVHLVTTPVGVGLREGLDLAGVYAAVAERWERADVIDGGRLLRSDDGAYPTTLPCLPHEDADDGCRNGEISVRGPDGVHFCDDPAGALACPSYSSGAWRFARTMADPLLEGRALTPSDHRGAGASA